MKKINAVKIFVIKKDSKIKENSKVICVQYKKSVHCSGYWDMPGGEIEEGETLIETCQREFKEETGMHTLDLTYKGTVITKYPEVIFHLSVFTAEKVEGIMGKEQEDKDLKCSWKTLEEIRKEEKRFAITYLLDEEYLPDLEKGQVNLEFTCDKDHHILDVKKN